MSTHGVERELVHLDCTLRDGGYYNKWDFPSELVNRYLAAVHQAGVDIAEVGFRFWDNKGFKGACAFTTEAFLKSLDIPSGLRIGVMLNASDLLVEGELSTERLSELVPVAADQTALELIRIASHIHEFNPILPACEWIKERGYKAGINLMQISDRTDSELHQLASAASMYSPDVLYFADSMGGMTSEDVSAVVSALRTRWDGPIGIHTHDNMGLALSNSMQAIRDGATWIDSTVTGMGRGPGNARTEELVIELDDIRESHSNMVPLLNLVRTTFRPLKEKYGWGTNPYYYLSGKHGIHPTYIQEMLGDARYDDEDVLAAIDHLRENGAKHFSFTTLDSSSNFFRGNPGGNWNPRTVMEGRDVLILGTGPGVREHQAALQTYIEYKEPLVLALNTQEIISPELIDLRIACHPVRLLADAESHLKLSQPLITPASMLPSRLQGELKSKSLRDFGLEVAEGRFEFLPHHCVAPTPLVIAYALGVVTSGRASRILLAGFDGYPNEHSRNEEMDRLIHLYRSNSETPVISMTPSAYDVEIQSLYGMIR